MLQQTLKDLFQEPSGLKELVEEEEQKEKPKERESRRKDKKKEKAKEEEKEEKPADSSMSQEQIEQVPVSRPSLENCRCLFLCHKQGICF